MGCDGFAVLKGLELVVCIVCVVLKRFSDYEALNVFFRLQKLSREWPFLNNITWEQNGSTFADITYGGFVIITAGLLLAYVMGELRRARKMEIFFLLLGVIMFAIIGGLELAALDAVPPELVDNAAALGVMSLVAALLFILDLILASKRPGKYKPPIDKITQTSETSTAVDLIPVEVEHKVTQTNGFVRSHLTDDKNHGEVIHELRSSLKGSKTSIGPNMYGESPDLTRGQKGMNGGINILNHGHQNGGLNIVENGEMMNIDAPKFEKMGHTARKVSDTNLHERKYSDQSERQGSHNLEKFKKPSRPKKTYSSGGSDYEYDDFIHLPTVSFLLAERGEMQRRRSLGSKSVERIGGKGTQMLPMMPVMSEESGDYFRRSRSIDQLVQKEDLERQRRELENQREQFAKERELYLFNSRKHKEKLASHEAEYNRKIQDSSPEIQDAYYRNTASTTPESGLHRKKSVTIQDLKSPVLTDDVREKLSQRGFIKISESDSKRAKNVGFSTNEYDDDKFRERKHVGTGTESPTPELIAIQKKAVSPDHGRAIYSGTHTPDYDRPNGKSLIRRLDSNASDHWRYDSRDANRHSPEDRINPSTPSDPGFVMHLAHNWPDMTPKTPSQSPSEKAQYRTSSDEDYRPTYNPPMDPPPKVPSKQKNGRPSEFRLETPQRREIDDFPTGGSLTTQLLQKWLKQRHTKVEKIKSNP